MMLGDLLPVIDDDYCTLLKEPRMLSSFSNLLFVCAIVNLRFVALIRAAIIQTNARRAKINSFSSGYS